MHLTEYNNLCFASLCSSSSAVASSASKSVRDTVVVGTVSTFVADFFLPILEVDVFRTCYRRLRTEDR
jgi:hypothetical protein